MKERLPISATVICRDEIDKIGTCLQSLRFCDEIVVVDSGSTDGTVELARKLADRVIEREWPGYVAQQNFARTAGRHDWVLSIDADERVSPELAEQVRDLFSAGPDCDAYQVNRHIHYLGRWIDHCGWYPEWRVRLFRKDAGVWEGIDPHYDIVVRRGRVGRLRGDLVHYTYDDMADHVHTTNRFTSISAREHHRRGRRFSWFHVLVRPPLEFLKMYGLQRGFLDGPQGFYVAAVSAFAVFLKFAKLWEIENVKNERPWMGSVGNSGGQVQDDAGRTSR